MVEATAQCSAECADPLLFLGTDLLPQLIPFFPAVPRFLPLLFLLRFSLYFSTISLQIPFSGPVDLPELLFPDIFQEGGEPPGADTWSQLSSERENGGEREGGMIRRETQRDQAICRVDPQNEEVFSPGGSWVLLTLLFHQISTLVFSF